MQGEPTTEYFERYKRVRADGEKRRVLNPERERHNMLSAPSGPVEQPKDFDWLEKSIPCQFACPAHTDIPGYLDAVSHGDYAAAYRINLRDNVFPAVLGRVCTRPCEPACRHGWEGLGEPVAICFAKRSADDFMQQKEPITLKAVFPPTGQSVAVIGAGAAGLSAAREMALLGHKVTVYERYEKPGGMMVQGIPEFRLPREVVEREIRQVELCGVEIRCGVEIGRDVTVRELLDTHDAVIMAAGTMKPYLPAIPGGELEGVHAGLPFLREANRTGGGPVGLKVVVIGGGFTAVDCARMALRLGADEVAMCYRRSEEEMYITPGEVEAMQEEGIAFHTHLAPLAIEGGDRVERVRFGRTVLGAPDETGRRTFEIQEGDEQVFDADTVLLATGQVQEPDWVDEDIRKHLVDAEGRPRGRTHTTGSAALFIAGDFGTGAGSLIDAIAHGKACARKVDEQLTGRKRVREVGMVEGAESTGRTREMDRIPLQPMPHLPVDQRGMADEVETGFPEAVAKTEAQRCYLCHYKFEIDNDLCIYCDRCLKVMPVDDCIVKVKEVRFDEQDRLAGYERSTSNRDYNLLMIDPVKCIRCGACRDVCPVECISIQKVSLRTVAES